MVIEMLASSPCGHLVPIPEGVAAFVPDPLPRELSLSMSLMGLLSEASRAVGTLGGVGETVPNPHLLIRPFVTREAVLSSRIEGTNTTMTDVFRFEVSQRLRSTWDTREVANHIRAFELGLERLNELPLCVRLINAVHSRLMSGVRGHDKSPGALRTKQVWIGPQNDTPIEEATYVPPPANLVRELLQDWEEFTNEASDMPVLMRCALMHYQFEAIHPYTDGNGRMGRLLISLFLAERRILPVPLLYLSAYFEHNQSEYYNHLFQLSADGHWETWIRFFLTGILEQSEEALIRIRRVRTLHDSYKARLGDYHGSGHMFLMLDELFGRPYMTAPEAARRLSLTPAGARRILDRLVDLDILVFLPNEWPRLFVATELLEIIDAPVQSIAPQ